MNQKIFTFLPQLLLAIFVITLNFYNLPALNIGNDEAIYLSAGKTLAEDGVYGIKTNYGYIPYWQKIRGGPTVIIPSAILFKFFGFNPLITRYYNAFISSLAALLVFFITQRLFGKNTAFLSTFFFFLSFWLPIEDMGVYTPINRYLNGEMTALLFMLFFIFFFYKFIKDRSIKYLYISGLMVGLSGLTKLHFLIVIIPALFAIFYAKLINKKCTLFIILVFLPTVLWLIWAGIHSGSGILPYIQLFFNFEGKPFSQSIIKWTQNFYGIFQFTPNTLEPIILFPSLAFSYFRIKNLKSEYRPVVLLLFLIICIWVLWFLVSIGYPRYLVPGILLGNIFTAWTFVYFLKDKKFRPFFAVALVLIIAPALLFTFQKTFKFSETNWVSSLQSNVYKLVPKGSKIEVKDFELYKLSKNYQIRFTPLKVNNYDPAEEGYYYIVGGFFDDYSQYENTLNKHKWVEIFSDKDIYKIYKLISL